MATAETEEPDTGHDYDGIREFDNPLPGWWLTTLWGTVIFAFGYWLYYQVFGGPGLWAQLQQDEAAVARKMAATMPISDELLVKLSHDSETLQKAQVTFIQQCAQCHGAHGEGKIGPNLTDDHYLHGKMPTEVYKTITEGYVKQGMPAWGLILGPDKVRGMASYIITLQGTHVAGKAPEGTIVP